MGRDRRFAVGGGRCGIYETADFCVAGCDEDVERAVDIDVIRVERIFHGTRYGGSGGKMQNVVSAFDRRLHSGQIGNTADAEIYLGANRGEIGFAAGGEIIEHYHFVISADKFVDNIRADEAGAAGNEIAHAGILLRFR